MKDFSKFLILVVIFIFTTIYDTQTRFKMCLQTNTSEILPILLFHRMLWVFLFFGWVFLNKYILVIYLLFNISLQIHWLYNSNECIITQIERKICNFPANSYSDYFYNLFQNNISLYYGLIQVVFCGIVVYKLLLNNAYKRT